MLLQLGPHLPSDPTGKPVLSCVDCCTHTVWKRDSLSLAPEFPKGNASEGVGFRGGITHSLFQGGGVESFFLREILFHSHRLGQEFNSK